MTAYIVVKEKILPETLKILQDFGFFFFFRRQVHRKFYIYLHRDCRHFESGNERCWSRATLDKWGFGYCKFPLVNPTTCATDEMRGRQGYSQTWINKSSIMWLFWKSTRQAQVKFVLSMWRMNLSNEIFLFNFVVGVPVGDLLGFFSTTKTAKKSLSVILPSYK